MNTFSIVTFTSNATVYKLKEPLPLENERYEGKLCLYNNELNLHAFGDSWTECMDKIREELEFLWENYAMEDDKHLTKGAVELKNKLRDMVEMRNKGEKK